MPFIRRVQPITSFTEYVDFISELGDTFAQDLCLYRGQICDKPLIPKIGRMGSTDIRKFEEELFSNFAKRYFAFSPKVYTSDMDLLALGQHFGLPTRLLDWTESALVALWFATEKDITEEHSVVWFFSPEDNDVIKAKDYDPFNVKSTKVFCPNHISERITAQSGWFTCHMLKAENKFLKFESLMKYREKLIKMTIAKDAFPEIRVKLNNMGVNAVSVYPDLVGLTSHLTWKHSRSERF